MSKTIIWVAVAGVVAIVVYSIVNKATAGKPQTPPASAVKTQPLPNAQLQQPAPPAPAQPSAGQQASQWVAAAGGAVDVARQLGGFFGSDDDGTGVGEDDFSYAGV